MNNSIEQLREFHWMMDMLQNIDVGLVVLNEDNEIQLWNSFMENHSGVIAMILVIETSLNCFQRLTKNGFNIKLNRSFS